MKASRTFRAFLIVASTVAIAASVQAQTAADGVQATTTPRWETAWSPFTPIAEVPWVPTSTTALPDLLGATAPRIGMFWTAGIPAAIPFEMRDQRIALDGAGAQDGGAYRRALDPVSPSVQQVTGLAWQPVGDWGGAVGRVVADREAASEAPFSTVVDPYVVDPFVLTDTTSPPQRRIRARLEGAFGWRFGSWGVGIAGGIEASDHSTVNARFAHLGRTAQPSAVLSLARTLFGGIRLAAFARWTRGTETISLTPYTESGRAYSLDGYNDPDPQDISFAQYLFRRAARAAHAFGGALSGSALGASWVAYAERGYRHDHYFTAQIANPPTDTWDAGGWRGGGALQRSVLDSALLLTATMTYAAASGDARLAALQGVIYRGGAKTLDLSLDARWAPARAWTVAIRGSWERMHWTGQDYIVGVRTDLVSWTPSITAAVARRFGAFAVSAEGGMGWYAAQGTIPDPSKLGPVYDTLVAPSLGLAATPARPFAAGLAIQQRTGRGVSLMLAGRWQHLSPTTTAVPSAPSGARWGWSTRVGVVVTQ